LNTMKLVKVSRQRLQAMREEGWNFLFEEVFCVLCQKQYCCLQNG
jgi:hypothetical protein